MSTSFSSVDGNDSDEDNDKKRTYSAAIVLFILNIIIIESATFEQFQEIGLGDRWTFHYGMMWSAASVVIVSLILAWITCVTVVSENNGCERFAKSVGFICMAVLLASFIVQYCLMGNLWHTDPEHTIIFYHKFWTEGVTNMNQAPSIPAVNVTTAATIVINANRALQGLATVSITHTIPHLRGSISPIRRLIESSLASKWVYVMSDVVVRIYGFIFMVTPVILALMLCCGGSAYICGKVFNKL